MVTAGKAERGGPKRREGDQHGVRGGKIPAARRDEHRGEVEGRRPRPDKENQAQQKKTTREGSSGMAEGLES